MIALPLCHARLAGPWIDPEPRLPRPEPELLHAGALAQSRYSWDRHGVGRPVQRLADEHVRKLEAMMRHRAAHFALTLRRGHADACDVCAAILARPEPGYASPPDSERPADDWIRTTLLHVALIAELKRRDLAELPAWDGCDG